jgi:FkbM family methyltransferase
MKIFYGILNNSIDVTDICLSKLMHNNIIIIPSGDGNRSNNFTDPLVGIHKNIIVLINDTLTEYDEYQLLNINVKEEKVTAFKESDVNDKLNNIHSKLNIKYGILNDEVPEQKMVVRYLTGNEKILEIGGNIGRNSLVMSSILQDSANLVTLECDTHVANLLKENRDSNNFNFNIESSALSNRRLIQRGLDTIPSDVLLEGYNFVNTITLTNLKMKYNIEFDTLVIDCEGAFYYILMDIPELLNNINLIIMENDYWDITKKNYIDEILMQNNFYVDYVEPGGWGPCYNNFYEVWKKSEK